MSDSSVPRSAVMRFVGYCAVGSLANPFEFWNTSSKYCGGQRRVSALFAIEALVKTLPPRVGRKAAALAVLHDLESPDIACHGSHRGVFCRAQLIRYRRRV